MVIPSGDSLPAALFIPAIGHDGADLLVEMVRVGRDTEIRAYNAHTGGVIPLDLEKDGRYYQRIRFEDLDHAREAWEFMFGKVARKKHDQIYKDLADWEFVGRRSTNDEHPSVVRDRGVFVDGRAGRDDPRPRHGSQRVAPPRSSRRRSRNSRASRRRRKHRSHELVRFLALSGAICALSLLAAFFVWEVSHALIGCSHYAVGLTLATLGAMWFGWRWMR